MHTHFRRTNSWVPAQLPLRTPFFFFPFPLLFSSLSEFTYNVPPTCIMLIMSQNDWKVDGPVRFDTASATHTVIEKRTTRPSFLGTRIKILPNEPWSKVTVFSDQRVLG
ncbi:hypothetical protein BDV34DRAFT_197720 [Aspergillus parasiticus]|uniref:Uncharacterized protein n=1 Tax=Aspergillus parasiticus TaxID=5067 RepID=A0A5N6DH94_ASPPA|nr:hypothetical protein BDV34DRAFT_197720 [Aspergillus parasiticus]